MFDTRSKDNNVIKKSRSLNNPKLLCILLDMVNEGDKYYSYITPFDALIFVLLIETIISNFMVSIFTQMGWPHLTNKAHIFRVSFRKMDKGEKIYGGEGTMLDSTSSREV